MTPRERGPFKKVLHVGSELSSVGGLTRMISRWIDADSDRTSSVVLTQHRGEVPEHLTEANSAAAANWSGLNRSIGDRFSWVRTLRRIGIRARCDYSAHPLRRCITGSGVADESGLPPVLFLKPCRSTCSGWEQALPTSSSTSVTPLPISRFSARARRSRSQFSVADNRCCDNQTAFAR